MSSTSERRPASVRDPDTTTRPASTSGADAGPAPVTVRRVLEHRKLGLRLLTPDAGPDAGLDAPVSWVAATDLEDPTPFLAEGNIVLTTGRQLSDRERTPAADTADTTDAADTAGTADTGSGVGTYVARLRSSGIRALGFATGVIREEVPADLVQACERERMPLFDVPYRTPFIAVTRVVADLVAAEAQSRSVWAADAQRSISAAALRSDGLRASVDELARRLDRPSALFDAHGDLLHAAGRLDVHEDVARLLARNVRAAAETADGIHLQTIGARGDLRGVLAVAGPLDHPAQSVVAGVVALAGMGLDQRRTLAEAQRRLHDGAWRSARSGELTLARDLAPRTFPAGEVTVGLVAGPESMLEVPALTATFVARHGPAPTGVGTASQQAHAAQTNAAQTDPLNGTFAVVAADTAWAEALNRTHDVPIGLSQRTDLTQPADLSQAANLAQAAGAERLTQAVREAELSLARARRLGGIRRFDEITDAGLDAVLAGPEAHALATALLRPLTEHDEAHGSDLVGALRAWLEHNGAWEQAAAQAGVHRHTLRSRIRQVEALTGRDLDSAHVRAEYVVALRLSRARDAPTAGSLHAGHIA